MASVLEKLSVMAKNDKSLNSSFTSATDLENGQIGFLGAFDSATKTYTLEQPATGTLGGMYMVSSSACPVITDASGNEYRMTKNPKNRVISAGTVFDGFKLQVGDKIKITPDGLAGTKSTNTYVEAVDGSSKLTWVAAPTVGSTALVLEDDEERINIAKGSFQPTQREVAYRFRVVQA